MSVGLPPMTIESASALYAQAKNAGADSLLIMAGGDERNLASVALRALVMMGDRVVELEQIAVSRDELLDEVMATIRTHIDSTLPPAEHIVPTSTTWRGTSGRTSPTSRRSTLPSLGPSRAPIRPLKAALLEPLKAALDGLDGCTLCDRVQPCPPAAGTPTPAPSESSPTCPRRPRPGSPGTPRRSAGASVRPSTT